jgi:hypothetical protein
MIFVTLNSPSSDSTVSSLFGCFLMTSRFQIRFSLHKEEFCSQGFLPPKGYKKKMDNHQSGIRSLIYKRRVKPGTSPNSFLLSKWNEAYILQN